MYVLKPDDYYVWSSKSLFLFLALVILAFFLSNLGIKKVRILKKERTIPFGLNLVTLLLILVKGFSSVGRDALSGYYYGFTTASNLKSFSDGSVELGYRLLAVIVHNIWNNYAFFLIVIATLTVCPVSYFAWKYRKYLDVRIVMMLYVTIYYFQGLSLLRIYLAASISLFVVDNLLKKKYVKALIYIFVASLFHTSMLVLLLPYLIFCYRKLSWGVYALLLLGVFIVFSVLGNHIIASLSGRYAVYSSLESGKMGYQQLLYYFPIFMTIYYGHKLPTLKSSNELIVYKISMSFAFAGFFMGELGYIIPILGRTQVIFLPLIYFISFYLKRLGRQNHKLSFWLTILAVSYGILRMYIYLIQYYQIDSIMPYSTFWGWVF